MPEEQRSFFQDEAVAATQAAMVTPMATVPSKITLSKPIKVDIEVYRGDSGTFRITVTEPDGSPADLTGATWDGDIRLSAGAPAVITNFDIQPTVGDPSSIDVILSSEKSELLSGACVYDIEMRLGTVVTTLITGSITITQDVSNPS
jgi:hypothetical protein